MSTRRRDRPTHVWMTAKHQTTFKMDPGKWATETRQGRPSKLTTDIGLHAMLESGHGNDARLTCYTSAGDRDDAFSARGARSSCAEQSERYTSDTRGSRSLCENTASKHRHVHIRTHQISRAQYEGNQNVASGVLKLLYGDRHVDSVNLPQPLTAEKYHINVFLGTPYLCYGACASSGSRSASSQS